jgi:hypothetical protein
VKEPEATVTFTAVGGAAAILGPVIGPFALVLFAAVMGGMLAMSKERGKDDLPMTRLEGVQFVAVSAGVAIVLSGFCVWLVERYTDIPGNIALMPVAFFLSLGRGFMLGLVERIVGVIGDVFAAYAQRRTGGDGK